MELLKRPIVRQEPKKTDGFSFLFKNMKEERNTVLCDGPICRPEVSYRVRMCVSQSTLRMSR